jgi:hydroxypyruvate isomerase
MTRKGRIKHSVCRWCFPKWTVEELAQRASQLGYSAMDLADPADWGVLKKHGLICAMTMSHDLRKGLSNPANHEACLPKLEETIRLTAAEGWPNVICFSGNRENGISDEAGLEHMATALRQVLPLAEKNNITLCLEILNSKVNHAGYMADTPAFGAKLAQKLGSPNFKLLFDIYHVEVQEGGVLQKLRQYRDITGHYHTAGVPGRHEIDSSQTLDYCAIMREIADSGFAGYVAQEFLPTKDPDVALAEAIEICDV